MLCWVNGKVIDAESLKVSPISHGAFYGVNCTEVLRTYNGEAVFLENYYAKLCERLKDYFMVMPYSITDIRQAIDQLSMQDNEESILSIHVTATEPNVFHFENEYREVLAIVMRSLAEPVQFYKEKEALWLQTAYAIDSPSTCIRARLEVPDLEKYEGFFVTKQGTIATSITSIIFWAKDDILYTPLLDRAVHPTVPRQLVMSLATAMGYQVREGDYVKFELEQADECFIVNPIEEIVPIHRLGDVTFAGQDGLLYERLYHAYGHEVSRQLRRD